MRRDMQKVLTERPRYGLAYAKIQKVNKGYSKLYRLKNNLILSDGDEKEYLEDVYLDSLPKHESTHFSHRENKKSFSDHINPLYKYLKKNCGNKWNDVYSEICKHVDSNSVTGRHLRQHVNQFVETNVTLIDNKPYSIGWRGFTLKTYGFYVCPETGILLECEKSNYSFLKKNNKDNNIIIEIKDSTDYLKQIKGIWYYCWIEKLTEVRFHSDNDNNFLEKEYISFSIERKNQLSKKQLNNFKLKNNIY